MPRYSEGLCILVAGGLIILIGTSLYFSSSVEIVYPDSTGERVELALAMLSWHESKDNHPKYQVGDGGKAHGFFQQHQGHWTMGCKRWRIVLPYPEGTHVYWMARLVVIGNWQVYCPEALRIGDIDKLILHHNKPTDPERAQKYLERVKCDWQQKVNSTTNS